MSTTSTGNVCTGMGAMPHASGVAFRVWAPHADAVYVTGAFNKWSPDAHPMAKEDDGYWYADISGAVIGEEYRYRILNSDWNGYSRSFGNHASTDVIAGAERRDGQQGVNAVQRDGFPAEGTISIGAYSVLIFSQDKQGLSKIQF